MMQQHGELAGDRPHRSFVGVLATAFGDLQPVASQIGVVGEGTEDVVGAAYHKPPEHLIAFFGDAPLGIALSRAVLPRDESQVRSDGPTLFQARRIFQNEHETKSAERPNASHLTQDPRLRIVLFGYLFKLALVLPDALR